MPRAFRLTGTTFTRPGLPTLFDLSFLAPNVLAWYAADQQVTVDGSSNVLSWGDLTGNGNALLNTSGTNYMKQVLNVQNGKAAVQNPATTNAGTNYLSTASAVASLGSFTSATPFTMVAVIKANAAFARSGQPFGNILRNGNANALSGVQLLIDGLGKVNIMIKGATVGQLGAKGSTTLIVNTPYNIIATYDGSNTVAGIQVYINGVAETMTAAFSTAIVGALAANGPLTVGAIGNLNFAATDYLLEVALLNIKMSAAQIANLDAAWNQKWATH